jgi:hypothetical protein
MSSLWPDYGYEERTPWTVLGGRVGTLDNLVSGVFCIVSVWPGFVAGVGDADPVDGVG